LEKKKLKEKTVIFNYSMLTKGTNVKILYFWFFIRFLGKLSFVSAPTATDLSRYLVSHWQVKYLQSWRKNLKWKNLFFQTHLVEENVNSYQLDRYKYIYCDKKIRDNNAHNIQTYFFGWSKIMIEKYSMTDILINLLAVWITRKMA